MDCRQASQVTVRRRRYWKMSRSNVFITLEVWKSGILQPMELKDAKPLGQRKCTTSWNFVKMSLVS